MILTPLENKVCFVSIFVISFVYSFIYLKFWIVCFPENFLVRVAGNILQLENPNLPWIEYFETKKRVNNFCS